MNHPYSRTTGLAGSEFYQTDLNQSDEAKPVPEFEFEFDQIVSW